MMRYTPLSALVSAFLLLAAGCAANIGAPQTRDEFVTMMKPGGLFANVDKATVSRPFKTVVADLTEYANKCLNVRATRAASYSMKEAGGSTTYRPKIETTAKDTAALSVQEGYGVTGSASGTAQANTGAPPGGIYVLVAEVRAAARNQTDVVIYYMSGRGSIADWLKKWAAGDKSRCPALS